MHLAPHQLLGNNPTDKAYRKYSRDFKDWKHSIDLADSLGKKDYSTEEQEEIKLKYNQMKDKIDKLNIKDKKLPISGQDLINMGLKPGPKFTKILNLVKDKMLENPDITKDEALLIVRDVM
jgi:hypothetical protein